MTAVDRWRPGDLIVFSAADPPFLSRRIIAAQELGGFAPEAAQWHHAAVYLGDRRLCESRWNGVRITSLFDYVGTHRIRVRRDPTLTPFGSYAIAINALFRRRWYDSVWTIVHAPAVLPRVLRRAGGAPLRVEVLGDLLDALRGRVHVATQRV